MTPPAHRWLAVALLALSLAAPFAAGPALAQQRSTLFQGFDPDSPDPIAVEADALDVRDNTETKTRVSLFTGNVVVTRGETLIKAQAFSIFSPIEAGEAAEALNNEAFTRIEANGQVSVTSGDQTVTGSDLVLDMTTRIVVITGNVILTDGGNVLNGNRLEINMDTGQANLTGGGAAGGRVRVLLPGAGQTPAAPR